MYKVLKVIRAAAETSLNYANKYLHVTFVFDKCQHFSAHKGFKHHLYNVKKSEKFHITFNLNSASLNSRNVKSFTKPSIQIQQA